MADNPKLSFDSLNYSQSDVEDAILGLANHGYAVIDNVLPTDFCSSLSKMLDEIHLERKKAPNENYSVGTLEEQRFVEATGQILLRDSLFQRPDALLPLMNLPPVINVIARILDDVIILDAQSATTTFRRDPRYKHPTKVHVDSPLAIRDASQTTHALVMICVDDFTSGNGGTRIWPGSHKSGILVHKTPGFSDKPIPGCVEIHINRGSLLFILGQTWHQAGINNDDSKRWALVFNYARWWIKPQTDYTQCGEEIFKLCNSEQKALLGFSSRPSPNRMVRNKTLIDPDSIPNNYRDALDS